MSDAEREPATVKEVPNPSVLDRLAMLRHLLAWQLTALLIRSPIVRMAAAVPLIGYVVLYGNYFQGMFSFECSLGPTQFSMEATARAAYIYYGGLSILVALLVYLWRCPRMAKRLHSEEQARDEFSRLQGLSKVVPLHTGHGVKTRIAPNWVTMAQYSLMTDLLIRLDDSAVEQVWLFLKSYRDSGDMPEGAANEPLYSKLILWLSSIQGTPKHHGLFQHVYWQILRLADASESVKIDPDKLMKVYTAKFHVANLSRPFSQTFVALTSWLGFGLAAYPAFMLLLQVLSVQFGYAEAPSAADIVECLQPVQE